MPFMLSKIPPHKPGVYQYKNAAGEIIYIGKAKDLSKRVRSYFSAGANLDSKTRQLVANIVDVEYIITDNELEALILESVLIRKHKPRFNIKLRDDKNYQFIIVDYSEKLPSVYSTRRKDVKNAAYFGPYTSGLNVRNTIRLIKKIFPYCSAEKLNGRPCFNYQLHRCPGVCVGEISIEEYSKEFSAIELFLQGKTDVIKNRLHKNMGRLVKKHQYERAAKTRDQLKALNELEEQQKIIATHNKNQDYISLYRKNSHAAANIFLVREGKLLSKENILIDNVDPEAPDSQILSEFLESYYLDATNIGKEVVLPSKTEDKELLQQFLENRFKETTGKTAKVKLIFPRFGTTKELLRLGQENAQNFLDQEQAKFAEEESLAKKSLQELKEVLSLRKLPLRIECFDISNISGKNAGASMVVFVNGRPKKDHYRKFRIRMPNLPNDYGMMSEILQRRLNNDWPTPDLWVIDGGKGQLNVALKVLTKRKQSISVIGLAKDRNNKLNPQEKIFLPGRTEPIILEKNNFALNLIQRIRDEAHRFALTYHRDLRSRGLFN